MRAIASSDPRNRGRIEVARRPRTPGKGSSRGPQSSGVNAASPTSAANARRRGASAGATRVRRPPWIARRRKKSTAVEEAQQDGSGGLRRRLEQEGIRGIEDHQRRPMEQRVPGLRRELHEAIGRDPLHRQVG